MTPDSIVAAARAALDTPFKHEGRQAGIGLDCAGLLVHVARAVGIEPLDRSGYARMPVNGQIEEALQAHVDAGILVRASITDMRPGDLFLMRFAGEKASRHLGICTGDTMIHAWAIVRKVCEHRIDETWRRSIVRVYRFSGVDHG